MHRGEVARPSLRPAFPRAGHDCQVYPAAVGQPGGQDDGRDGPGRQRSLHRGSLFDLLDDRRGVQFARRQEHHLPAQPDLRGAQHRRAGEIRGRQGAWLRRRNRSARFCLCTHPRCTPLPLIRGFPTHESGRAAPHVGRQAGRRRRSVEEALAQYVEPKAASRFLLQPIKAPKKLAANRIRAGGVSL